MLIAPTFSLFIKTVDDKDAIILNVSVSIVLFMSMICYLESVNRETESVD